MARSNRLRAWLMLRAFNSYLIRAEFPCATDSHTMSVYLIYGNQHQIMTLDAASSLTHRS